MNRLVVVNQTVGPFYFEFLSELVRLDKFSDIVLITGSSDQQLLMEFTELGIVIDRGIEYQKSNPILRVGTWLLFSLAVLVKVLISQCSSKGRESYWVFCSNPPLLAPLLGLIRALRLLQHDMDVYPEILRTSNYLSKESWLFRVWSYLDSKFLQGANCVLTLDDQIRDKLIELHPYLSATGRIEIVPLTLGLKLKESMCIEQNPIALDLRIADRDVVVAYSGNMGIGHDFDMFKQKTSWPEKIKFVFIGGGTAHDELRSLHSDNSQFVFRPFYPHSDLKAVLCLPDLAIISVGRNADALLVPSKFFSYCSYGIPMLFIGPRDHTLAKIISRYELGFVVENGDISTLFNVLNSLDRETLSNGFEIGFSKYIRDVGRADISAIFGGNPEH